jgi:hypothetical protein
MPLRKSTLSRMLIIHLPQWQEQLLQVRPAVAWYEAQFDFEEAVEKAEE